MIPGYMVMGYIFMFTALFGSVLALIQRDLMKAVILIGLEGLAVAFLYQMLRAPDVAITQAILGAALLPGIFAIAVYKTRREEE
jgi:energy-converting hydrogenase B subunit D